MRVNYKRTIARIPRGSASVEAFLRGAGAFFFAGAAGFAEDGASVEEPKSHPGSLRALPVFPSVVAAVSLSFLHGAERGLSLGVSLSKFEVVLGPDLPAMLALLAVVVISLFLS